jgi:hypothetical protein
MNLLCGSAGRFPKFNGRQQAWSLAAIFYSTMLIIMKILLTYVETAAIFYVLICIGLYFFQEKLIFFPEKLDKNYRFTFNQPFEEINLKTAHDNSLNGLLFRSDRAKGLVFYLHGNAGSLKNWEMWRRDTCIAFMMCSF